MHEIYICMYEIWSNLGDQGTHIVDVWVQSKEEADKIASGLGGVADFQMDGYVYPERHDQTEA